MLKWIFSIHLVKWSLYNPVNNLLSLHTVYEIRLFLFSKSCCHFGGLYVHVLHAVQNKTSECRIFCAFSDYHSVGLWFHNLILVLNNYWSIIVNVHNLYTSFPYGSRVWSISQAITTTLFDAFGWVIDDIFYPIFVFFNIFWFYSSWNSLRYTPNPVVSDEQRWKYKNGRSIFPSSFNECSSATNVAKWTIQLQYRTKQ